MAELKTKATEQSVEEFLAQVDEDRRHDCREILELMQDVTGEEPKMWGTSMVGFGSYHYRYASGHEGDTFLTGFSPRKRNLSIYLSVNYDQEQELMEKLGKHKTGKGCLYINRLGDVDKDVLRTLVEKTVRNIEHRSVR